MPRNALESGEARLEYLDAMNKSMAYHSSVAVNAHDLGISANVSVMLRKSAAHVELEVQLDNSSNLDCLLHPLADQCPAYIGGHCIVDTAFWPHSCFEYLHPALRGPVVKGQTDQAGSMLRYLARLISHNGIVDGDRCSRRFVEPGIGRTFLVDFLCLTGYPEIHDFSATGIGITPYASAGFVLNGPDIDGYCSLLKAMHRRDIAERLCEAGCRVPVTCAIIKLGGIEKVWPDGRTSEAAIIVRGSRMVLRVQQFDPLHGYFHSPMHSLLARDYIEKSPELLKVPSTMQPHILDRCAKHFDLRPLVYSDRYRSFQCGDPCRVACEIRAREIYQHAPVMVRLAKLRLAHERGQYPCANAISSEDYVIWFAETIGKQMAIMRRERFLFDYRVGRNPNIANALHESQISLLAEFHDLDTGVFIESPQSDGVILTRDQYADLRRHYSRWHARELVEALAIVRSVSLVVDPGNLALAAMAVNQAVSAYSTGSR